MQNVRIWFNKTGEVKYISHLDLMRCFTRAIRRAEIPLWFTEGFNPRPYMQFALPLSLGMESVCECVDIKIDGDISFSEIQRRLIAVMPKGLDIIKVTEPVTNPKFIAFGEFDIVFSQAESLPELEKLIINSLTGDSLKVEKIGKKGKNKEIKQIDLIEHIKSAEVRRTSDTVVCTVVLPAGGNTNINPYLLSDKIAELYGKELRVGIVRKKLMLQTGEIFK